MAATFYTKPNCGPCVAARRWLDREGVPYVTASAEDHAEYLRNLGARQSPVIVSAGGEVVSGFDPTAMSALFKNKG